MSIIKFLLPLVLVLATCQADPDPIFDSIEPQHFQTIPTDYRLPTEVTPVSYKIKLEPFLDASDKDKRFTFEGESIIDLKVKKQTKQIIFHAKELKINKDNLKLEYLEKDDKGKKIVKSVKLKDYKEDKDRDFVTLNFEENLIPNYTPYILTIPYTGVLNDEKRGFYRSSYNDEHNNTIWLAATHFEPVAARQAFPCWDEPALKAKFHISIIYSKDYRAISNMPFKNETKVEDKVMRSFEETPDMSTYLVAFVVSRFKPISTKENDFQVWTRPEIIESAKYAFDIGIAELEELEKFTGIKYKKQNMTKMDQIAVPDLAAGAMENWGLVTYRENALLYTENVTNTKTKEDITTVISHEFAHQWFGNLVTPKWWKYIWLNEGFAHFFQYYITEQVINKKNEEPSWRLMEQFVVKSMQEVAFVTDASTKTRPLNQDGGTPDQIKSLFDNIAYRKAGCIIRMMQYMLTEDIFQKWLQAYLEKNKFKSVDSDDLFNSYHFSEGKGKRINIPVEMRDLMNGWVNKEGYPVIKVDRNNETGDALITQTRFLMEKPTKEDKTVWWIPLSYVTEKAPQENITEIWFDPYTTQVIVKNLNVKQWVLFNVNQRGYYRVNYDVNNWDLLTKYLQTKNYEKIFPVNRAQLIDDSLNLARAGILDYTIALPTTIYLSEETDYIPWYAAIRAFDYLDIVLFGTKDHKVFHKYVAQKLNGIVKDVGFEETKNDTHVIKLARELVTTAACKYGLDECKKAAADKFNNWLKDNEKKLPIDLRRGIFCSALQDADENMWNMTLERYMSIKDKIEKTEILAGLGCVKSKEIVRKFLELTLVEKPVIDIFTAMKSIHNGNRGSFDILLDFTQENIEKVKAADKNNELLIDHINRISNRITTIEQYGKLTLFIHREQLQNIEQFDALNNGKINLNWIEKYQEQVSLWFIVNYKEPGKPDSATSVTITSFLIIVPLLVSRLY